MKRILKIAGGTVGGVILVAALFSGSEPDASPTLAAGNLLGPTQSTAPPSETVTSALSVDTTTSLSSTTTTPATTTTALAPTTTSFLPNTTTTLPPTTTTTKPATTTTVNLPAGCKDPCVNFVVTPGAFCKQTDAHKYGLTSTGKLMRCVTTPDDSRYRWREA